MQSIIGPSKEVRDRGRDDEKRKQGQQCHIGKVAGMDETVVVDAGQDPLDDLQCARTWPQLIEMPLPAIAPSLLGREGREVTHLESKDRKSTRLNSSN